MFTWTQIVRMKTPHEINWNILIQYCPFQKKEIRFMPVLIPNGVHAHTYLLIYTYSLILIVKQKYINEVTDTGEGTECLVQCEQTGSSSLSPADKKNQLIYSYTALHNFAHVTMVYSVDSESLCAYAWTYTMAASFYLASM